VELVPPLAEDVVEAEADEDEPPLESVSGSIAEKRSCINFLNAS
jgi:hypothetical protein